VKPNLIPPGAHPGTAKLKPEVGVFRATIRPVTDKKRATYADYAGVMELSAGARAQVLIWSHSDGSIGLRLELIKNKPNAAQGAKLSPNP
jgi:hypothetical protein